MARILFAGVGSRRVRTRLEELARDGTAWSSKGRTSSAACPRSEGGGEPAGGSVEAAVTGGGISVDVVSTLGGNPVSAAAAVGGAMGSSLGTGAAPEVGCRGTPAGATAGTLGSSVATAVDEFRDAEGEGLSGVFLAAAAAANRGLTFLAPRAGFRTTSSLFSFCFGVKSSAAPRFSSKTRSSCRTDGSNEG